MSLTVNKKTLTVEDIWQKYVDQLLLDNPEYWSRYQNSMSNYVVYTKFNNMVVEVMNYKRFRDIIITFFEKAKKEIINGNAINIGSQVGKICARRVERNFNTSGTKRINWIETKKQPLVEGKDGKLHRAKHILFTDDEYCRIGWHRTFSIKNESVYEFKPTKSNIRGKGECGFKKEFTDALREDPLLKFQYLYMPLKIK